MARLVYWPGPGEDDDARQRSGRWMLERPARGGVRRSILPFGHAVPEEQVRRHCLDRLGIEVEPPAPAPVPAPTPRKLRSVQ